MTLSQWGGQNKFIFWLEPADSHNLIHHAQRSTNPSQSLVALKPKVEQKMESIEFDDIDGDYDDPNYDFDDSEESDKLNQS